MGLAAATRIALDRGETETVDRLLAMLPVGLPGWCRRCCGPSDNWYLAGGRDRGVDDAAAAFGSALTAMREMSPPHLLAQGLLDHAEYLVSSTATGPVRPRPSTRRARSVSASAVGRSSPAPRPAPSTPADVGRRPLTLAPRS